MTSRIADNVARIGERIAAAAARSGRHPEDIKLVAVTKSIDLPEIEALLAAGLGDLGESRPQELWQKAAALNRHDIRWHLVGHLQRNKIRRTLPLVSLIHSADSRRLIEAIDAAAADLGQKIPLLLEVNISGDHAKHGFAPEDLERLLPELAELRQVEVQGLMAMASLEGGLNTAQRNFAALRNLRDHLRSTCPPEIKLDDLSMGMSEDFETAIHEGATILRIGSAWFE